MFRAGDPLNPYDPAYLDIPNCPFEFIRRLKERANEAAEIFDDPEKRAAYEQCLLDSAEERERTRETMYEQMMREKREWAAADAKKLNLYETAIADASAAVEKGDFSRAKAHFRRGQGWCFLGEWVKGEEEYTIASTLQPGDRNILREVEELERLRNLSSDDQAAWLSTHAPATLSDIFEPGEMKRRAEEVAGYSLD
ncbi:hypothetical protein DFH09DRAFT_1397258 [Mycena vulgaris]|nr:hypothetical protein DFH09DRAFT_1397258 [Mycena vulgaris]